MANLSEGERKFISRKEKNSSEDRYEIPIEHSNPIQMRTSLLIAPQEVRDLIAAGNEDLHAMLLSRYMDKYFTEKNGLDMFCADPKVDHDVVTRFIDGSFSDDDLRTLGLYVQENMGLYFSNDKEVKDFIYENIH